MRGPNRGSGTRSNLYSTSKFTNWTPHDPYWSEVSALPRRMRAAAFAAREREDPLAVYERPLVKGFVRPWSAQDVVSVLAEVPSRFLAGLTGVYLLGGTEGQRRLKAPTFGMYNNGRIYLCSLAVSHLSQTWEQPPKPSIRHQYTRFGAIFAPSGRGRESMTFDLPSLRQFELYDVLLHEVGHHVDTTHQGKRAERFALWFADFQHARLRERAGQRDAHDASPSGP